MSSNKKISLEPINNQKSIKQFKNLKNELILFQSQEKKGNLNQKKEALNQKENKILSIISNCLPGTINYFIKDDYFNFEFFINTLLEIIKQKLTNIIKNSKSIENSIFNKINKNTIKKIQSIIINFLISFYDFYEYNLSYSNNDDIIEAIINKNSNVEDSFLISCSKIILILNNNLNKERIKNFFNEKFKDNIALIKELILLLIKVLNLFIIIKKNKESFNIEDNTSDNNLKTNKGYYNYNHLKILINEVYKANESILMKLLYDFIFNNNYQYFFSKIIKNDENTYILLNSLSMEKDNRNRLMKILNESLFILEKQNLKDLLKAIQNNDSITIIFNYISEDLKNKRYSEISELLEELKNIYIFSLLIHSHDINTEKIIIKLLNANLYLANNDKNNTSFNNFINSIYKLTKNIPKYKYKIYNFLLLIFDSIKIIRKIISQVFFNNLKGNIEAYSELIKNVNFNLFIDNLSSSEADVINNYFSYLYTLDKNEYLPLNEVIKIIGQLPFFTDPNAAEAFIQNLKIITDINYLLNKKEMDIYNIGKNDDDLNIEEDNFIKSENKNNNINKYNKFIKQIYQSYINILYKIISEIKENINSIKYKSPFDIDVTVSSIINTNYSEDNNKKFITNEILDIFLDFLGIIIKDNKMLQYFISKKFLEFFPSLVNDDSYKSIAYKIIQIFLNSPCNNEDNTDKNKQQILMILNRFYLFFSKSGNNQDLGNEDNNKEFYKLKELILMQQTIIIYFKKKLINVKQENEIENTNFNDKIINFYFFYTNYFNENSKYIYKTYNDEYHSIVKKYLSIIIEIISISNQNIITKNKNFSPSNFKKHIKDSISNIITFYYNFPERNENKYFLDIIKYFIDKSFNFNFSEDKVNNINESSGKEKLSEEDFTLYYIDKYKIDKELLSDNNDNKNKSIISNFFIQSPMILFELLKILFKYNKFLSQYLSFILFLCKINQQNISFLLRQNLLKILFNILIEKPSLHDIIFQICKLCFKFLQTEDVSFLFEQLIKLSNNIGINDNNQNKDFIKEILHYITNSLRCLSISSNDYFKGILLSKYKIRQPNIYNMLEINNINFFNEKTITMKDNCNILVKQEIYFYKSLKTKKLLLLRIENYKNQNDDNNENFKETSKSQYLEISFRNYEILVTENDEQIKYDDLSNYNSIFIDNEKIKTNTQNFLTLNKNNSIIYIFKENKKILSIYINGYRVVTYKYRFKFDEIAKIKIGFPLDLVKEVYDNEFKLFKHIKIKSLKIFLQKSDKKENIRNIYQLVIDKISCDYLFADELTNFKLDDNTKLLSKYNNLYSVRINSIFQKNFIKSQFYKKIFFTEKLLLHSLDYLFRLEKYIFILLNDLNIDKIIFNELISLLCTYLIINESFEQKFLSKEEFNSSLYFSLYRNAKYIDKETIENLLSVVIMNIEKKKSLNHSTIIDILLDTKLFNLLNPQIKNDLINSINNKVIQNYQYFINKVFILEKLSKILILCQFNNKTEIDELIINIIFNTYENNQKDENIKKIIEEIIYILFNFDLYTSNHLSKFKNGRNNETSKIIYKYFNKIYHKDSILNIKEFLLKKLDEILLVSEFKNKLIRLISIYSPPKIKEENNDKYELNNDSNNILNFEDDDDDDEDEILFKLPDCPYNKVRSLSYSFHGEHIIKNDDFDKENDFKGRIDIKKKTVIQTSLCINRIKKINKKDSTFKLNSSNINDYSLKMEEFRRNSSVKPTDDVILFKGVINTKKRKSLKYLFGNKKEKKRISVLINITDKDKENCEGDCHLCRFIKKLLVSIFQREIKFGIYKNYLLHCLTEVFIINKNLDFKLNFSYYLMKREGPNRIRKKFNVRVDRLLNSEYDRSVYEKKSIKKNDTSINIEKKLNNNIKLLKEKSIDLNDNKEIINENEIEKKFMFYENKKNNFSENLLNFYNLGQIYNIDITSHLIDSDDKFKAAFNCLLFKGFSYINSVFILGKNKIYILSTANISTNNILYDAHSPITKRFWIIKQYNDILHEHCYYLNSYDMIENNTEMPTNKTNQKKKKIFEKTIKGFWLYSFYYVEINEIHKRKYLHQNNAIEIFLKNGKNYYLAFNIDIRDKLVKYIIRNIKYSHQSNNVAFFINNNYNSIKNSENSDIKNNNNNSNKNDFNQEINDYFNNLVYEIQNESLMKSENMIFIMDSNLFIDNSKKYKKNRFYKNIFNNKKIKYSLASILDINDIIDKSYDKWTNGHLDTYSYLMILNTISGRTYNDIAQYPVYPWVLSNYSTKELDLNKPNSYRDFLYPIYAQDKETRDHLKEKFDSFEEDQRDIKYHSGSHYSNAGFICYYLIRIKPFSQLAAEVQGEYFDTPDRLFSNIESFYKVNEKYQELIPDVYNIPEIMINLNKFNLGINSDGKNIDNVCLPPWASYSPRLFCKILKRSLESQYTSMNINNWIDLIFGYKQKGSEAEKYCNVLRNVCSGFNPKKDCENENEVEQKINEICELGIDPIQIFNKPHHKRERHQKIKAFFGRNIYMTYFKEKEEKYFLKNLENNCTIKEMNKYYEFSSKYLSKGEGGLSSFRMCYDEDNENNNLDNKEGNNNLIYFVISGKKTLLPPSYKNYIQWTNHNNFYIIKPFKKVKYEFTIKHMKKQSINCIKITKDGNYIIIGYSNGIIEKYKLARIWGPKMKKIDKENISSNTIDNKDKNIKSLQSQALKKSIKRRRSIDEKTVHSEQKMANEKEHLNIEKFMERPKEKSLHIKGGLFNSLFGQKKKKSSQKKNDPKKASKFVNKVKDDDEEENKIIIEEMEKNISNKNKNNTSIMNEILFDTQIPISTSNIINSDCIILNNNTGKFIQYNGFPSYFETSSKKKENEKNEENNKHENNSINNISQMNIIGYDIHSNNKNYINNLLNKENQNNSLSKHYIIFLINSSNRILSEISLIEICESYSFMIIVDKFNNVYLYDFNTFDLIKCINCSKYFKQNIKYISICPYSGDFILASYYKVILMSINGVFITQMNNIKSKISHCFITSIYKASSDLYLFTAHENGSLLISKLINNLSGYIFNMNKLSLAVDSSNKLLTSMSIDALNNKYDPIRIKNISKVYHEAYDNDSNCVDNKEKEKLNKYLENNNNFSIIFDTPIEIKCSNHPIKFIKLSNDLSSLLCINSKNIVIYFNYEEFFLSKKKNKDKKMLYCEKCQNILNSFKTLCQICGKKLCPICKTEIIIAECSLKNPKPICNDCLQLMAKNNQNLYDF